MWSHDKLKTMYLHYHNAYWYYTCQRVDILWGAPTHKFAWHLNEVVLWAHVANQIYYISTCRRTMETKLGKVLSYCLPPLKSHGFLIMWRTWGHLTIWKIYISPVTRFMATKFDRVLTWGEGSTSKCLSRHRLPVFFYSSLSSSPGCFWIDWQNLFLYFSLIVALGGRDQHRTYQDDMLCAFMQWTLEINSNDRFKKPFNILLFNRYKH